MKDINLIKYLSSSSYQKGWLKSIEQTANKQIKSGMPAKTLNTKFLFSARRDELQEAFELGCLSQRRLKRYLSKINEVEHKLTIS